MVVLLSKLLLLSLLYCCWRLVCKTEISRLHGSRTRPLNLATTGAIQSLLETLLCNCMSDCAHGQNEASMRAYNSRVIIDLTYGTWSPIPDRAKQVQKYPLFCFQLGTDSIVWLALVFGNLLYVLLVLFFICYLFVCLFVVCCLFACSVLCVYLSLGCWFVSLFNRLFAGWLVVARCLYCCWMVVCCLFTVVCVSW